MCISSVVINIPNYTLASIQFKHNNGKELYVWIVQNIKVNPYAYRICCTINDVPIWR